MTDQKVLEAKVKRLARRHGFIVRKSRRAISVDNLGGFAIIDADLGCFLDGNRFDLTAEDLIERLS